MALKTLARPVLNTGIGSIIKLIYAFLSNNVQYQQLEVASNRSCSIRATQTMDRQVWQLQLAYIGHYRVINEYGASFDIAFVMNVGSGDFYLKLVSHNLAESRPQSFMEEMLQRLKQTFEINEENRKFVIRTYGGKSPGQVREVIHRILLIDPSLKSVLLRGNRLSPSPSNTDDLDNLPEQIDFFLERPALEQTIDHHLKNGGRVTLVGPSGLGKSQIALRFAAKQDKRTPRWFRADTKEKFEGDLINLALSLGILTAIEQKQAFMDQVCLSSFLP